MNNSVVVEREEIDIELVKLPRGGRVLRLFDSESGLVLERVLDPAKPVAAQKKRLLSVFLATLANAELMPA